MAGLHGTCRCSNVAKSNCLSKSTSHHLCHSHRRSSWYREYRNREWENLSSQWGENGYQSKCSGILYVCMKLCYFLFIVRLPHAWNDKLLCMYKVKIVRCCKYSAVVLMWCCRIESLQFVRPGPEWMDWVILNPEAALRLLPWSVN